jgi:glutamate carboxypeptidase
MASAASSDEAARARRLLDWARDQTPAMVECVERMVRIESPSTDGDAQAPILELIARELESLDFRTLRLPGRRSGGGLYASARDRARGRPAQLLIGHCDTVWPVETLQSMPLAREDDRLRGPGAYDMKAGLTQLLFALRATRELELSPSVSPLVLVNSDEEIGSRESTLAIGRLARRVDRALVLEPSLGREGRLKTARKGVGRFVITVRGRAAHAGLDPESGVSAILELSHVIQQLFELNDVERGVSVNVGTVEGGLAANVVAPESRAVVDVRVRTHEDARRIEQAIHALRAVSEDAELEIEGAIVRPPFEPSQGSERLWELAHGLALGLGVELQQGAAGGASDGNTTSAWTPTLDGLGAVGDGAHAHHEFVFVDKLAERTALLALIILSPALQPRSPSARGGS